MAEATIPTFMRGKDKIMSLPDAVKTFIKPGTCICPGGFSYTKKPFALAREVIRQRIGDLFVTMNGGASIADFWAGAGLIKLMDTTYIGLEGIQPVAYNIRRSIQDGTIDIEDYSNYGYGLRTVAGRYGWPFAPCMAEMGTDLSEHDTFKKMGLRGKKADGSWVHPSIPPERMSVIEDPFDGWGLRPHAFEGGDNTSNQTNALEQVREATAYTGNKGVKVILVPPILPEVTIVLAQRVGERGTTRIEGILGPDAEQAIAAKYCIVQAEKVVTEEELRAQPYSNNLALQFVDSIVEVPYGGFPGQVPYYYDYDWDFWRAWAQLNKKPKDEVSDFMYDWVCDDEWTFLSTRPGDGYPTITGTKGLQRLFELRADAIYSYKPGLARPL
ncbi:glutaconate CoA-transferase subunit A [bacterium BMS3Abin14]|nr:glutaconate CoA-transferase subunit A [bacterium BMS3Abin14]